MSYVDTEDLETLISDLNNSVTDSLKTLSIKASDTWIESKLESLPIQTTDKLVISAATYFAYCFILRNLYDTDEDESKTMVWYENLANEQIGAYINKMDLIDPLDSPYSSNKSKPYTRNRRDLL
nr:hypothetical protein [Methanobrevibacter arboriphilus]